MTRRRLNIILAATYTVAFFIVLLDFLIWRTG